VTKKVYLLITRDQVLYPNLMHKVDQTDGTIRRVEGGFTVEEADDQFGHFIPDSNVVEAKYYREPIPSQTPVELGHAPAKKAKLQRKKTSKKG
jgi:hypothetical protein